MTASHTPTERQEPRMGRLARLPVFYALTDKRVVVAGGTPAAAWKAELLSAAGADVHVFPNVVSDEMAALAANPPHRAIVLHRRCWETADFADAALAIGGFDDN